MLLKGKHESATAATVWTRLCAMKTQLAVEGWVRRAVARAQDDKFSHAFPAFNHWKNDSRVVLREESQRPRALHEPRHLGTSLNVRIRVEVSWNPKPLASGRLRQQGVQRDLVLPH